MSDIVAETQKRIFADNLRRLMEEKGTSQDDIVRRLGYSSSTVSDWCNAKKYPRIKKMQELADMLGVSVSDLRDQPSAPIPHSKFREVLSESGLRLLLDEDANVPDENLEDIIKYIRLRQGQVGK